MRMERPILTLTKVEKTTMIMATLTLMLTNKAEHIRILMKVDVETMNIVALDVLTAEVTTMTLTDQLA